ncbi:LuxR C-terminal-related transcriptional regulator [Myxosarcina sp. GI1]|uniref:LuxR C-terminal-related transcriptional regulator n=1 Tax=Myxosarcina sp. GI1 TaxID=1541065 RepID=UPI00055F9884|nr:LuxR C-terminal-related transcriptional regulator [Myxosarcina sp. GI1]
MYELGSAFLDPTRLLFELQNINRLNQSLAGNLEPEAIARRITDGLVDNFDCAFARIWLVDSDRNALTLVASSGMYTRLDGEFAKVPMGAYKVGKIAQHGIPFLSNQLAAESWVKDRQWAIANNLCGFAGLPLAISDNTEKIADRVIGVLAVFSHQPMNAEFLEALRILCSSVAVALNNARLYRHKSQDIDSESLLDTPLSEQISEILSEVRLTLVGTEQSLTISVNYILLRTAEILKANKCSYCRLTYEGDRLCLEAMSLSETNFQQQAAWKNITLVITSMGGEVQTAKSERNLVRLRLFIPYTYKSKTESSLSHREREIVQLLAEGLRDREIAQKLFISDRTVKFHVNNAVNKLQARTRIQAIYKAYSKGFLGL